MTIKKRQLKGFDAVAFLKKERDRISKDIEQMDFEEIKTYFAKNQKSGKKATAKKPGLN